MEISRTNYLKELPDILRKLESASFISFDAEFTGLKSETGEMTSLFDSPADRYTILRQIAMSNSAPQFGIALFYRTKNSYSRNPKQMYMVDAYTMHLMEPSFAGFNMTRNANVEVDCNQFLTAIQFDFEKWVMNSVPYLNNERVKELETYLENNPDFMEKCREQGRRLDPIFFPEYKPLLSKEEQKEIVKRLRGFSAIVDVITRKKIPVIGHNMTMDLLYFFSYFCKELPEKYEDFKSEVGMFLPMIFDTKFMTVKCRKMLDHPALPHSKDDIDHLQCSGLYIIYKTSSSVKDKFSPQFLLLDSCKRFHSDLELGKELDLEGGAVKEKTLCHQPSFDACVTGMVFLYLAHISCRISRELMEREAPPTMEEILFHVNQWRDQIFVSRGTVMTMCLRGDDPRPTRTWFKVTYFGEQDMSGEQVAKILKGDHDIKRGMMGVDVQSVGRNKVMMAIARHSNAKDLAAKLTKKGFLVEKMMIPWDKKRMDHAQGCSKDEIYDSGRNKFFC